MLFITCLIPLALSEMEYKEVPIRWWILTIFSMSTGVNGMMWVTLSPITSEASQVLSK